MSPGFHAVIFCLLLSTRCTHAKVQRIKSTNFVFQVNYSKVTWYEAFEVCRNRSVFFINSRRDIADLRLSHIPYAHYWSPATVSEADRIPESIFPTKRSHRSDYCPALALKHSRYEWRKCLENRFYFICKETLTSDATPSSPTSQPMRTTTPAVSRSTDIAPTTITRAKEPTTTSAHPSGPTRCSRSEQCLQYKQMASSRHQTGLLLDSVVRVSPTTCAARCFGNSACCAFELHKASELRRLLASAREDLWTFVEGADIFRLHT